MLAGWLAAVVLPWAAQTGIAAQVACEYVVGFNPPPSDGAPKRHKVEVRLARKELGKVLGGTRMVEH